MKNNRRLRVRVRIRGIGVRFILFHSQLVPLTHDVKCSRFYKEKISEYNERENKFKEKSYVASLSLSLFLRYARDILVLEILFCVGLNESIIYRTGAVSERCTTKKVFCN